MEVLPPSGQSETRSNVNEKVLYTPQSFRTRVWTSDAMYPEKKNLF